MFPSPYQHWLSPALIHLPDRNSNWKKMMHPSQILHLNIILFRRWTWQQQGSLRGEAGARGKLASNHENRTFWLFEPTPSIQCFFLVFWVFIKHFSSPLLNIKKLPSFREVGLRNRKVRLIEHIATITYSISICFAFNHFTNHHW